jgi:two-component system sensor histidine kinase/response regulator
MANVLIIDDEPDILEFLVTLIEEQGHTASGMTSAERALEVVDLARFDLIVLDVVMAPRELDGIGFLFRLRKNPQAARVPVLLVSGLASVINRNAAEHLGIRGLHLKPIDTELLLAQVASILGEGTGSAEVAPVDAVGRSDRAP